MASLRLTAVQYMHIDLKTMRIRIQYAHTNTIELLDIKKCVTLKMEAIYR